MFINNNEENTLSENSERPILEFRDIEKIGGDSEWNFPFGYNGYYFQLWRLQSSDWWWQLLWHNVIGFIWDDRAEEGEVVAYEGSDLQTFNDAVTCHWGYIELMAILWE